MNIFNFFGQTHLATLDYYYTSRLEITSQNRPELAMMLSPGVLLLLVLLSWTVYGESSGKLVQLLVQHVSFDIIYLTTNM